MPATDFAAAHENAQRCFVLCAVEADRAMLAMDATTLTDLLRAEEHLPDDARAVILPLAEEGMAHANRAIELRPDDARGYLLLAMNTAMLGVARGKLDAFMAGIPARVIRAFGKAIELDETCEAAGPLQVEGRFRSVVPFPYRNLRRARASLERASRIARVKQTLYFLGDAHARAGDLAAAEQAWRAALEASPFPPAKPVAGYVDLLIERRLEFVSETASPPR